MSNLGDYYFIKELLDRETALSHNEEAGYYSVNNAYFSSNFTFPESSYAYSFYNAMRAVFRSNYDYSNDSGFNNHETLHFFTFSGDDNLYYCFHNTPGIRGNTSKGEYYEVQFNPQQTTRNIYKYDTSTNEISVYSHMGSASSYKSVPVYKFLASTGSLFVWGTNTNINYVNIEGNSGNTSGGWQVPNPNPTRKIVINGSEPDDIKLNGVTPDKIMLNGQCYFEKAPEPDPHNYLYKWDFTKSLTDEVAGVTAELINNATIDNNGINITENNHAAYLGEIDLIGKTLEIEYGEIDIVNNSDNLYIVLRNNVSGGWLGASITLFKGISGGGFLMKAYSNSDGSSSSTDIRYLTDYLTNPTNNYFSNKKIKFIFGGNNGVSNGNIGVYINDVLIVNLTGCYLRSSGTYKTTHMYVGGGYEGGNTTLSNSSDDSIIKSIRIYENEE